MCNSNFPFKNLLKIKTATLNEKNPFVTSCLANINKVEIFTLKSKKFGQITEFKKYFQKSDVKTKAKKKKTNTNFFDKLATYIV